MQGHCDVEKDHANLKGTSDYGIWIRPFNDRDLVACDDDGNDRLITEAADRRGVSITPVEDFNIKVRTYADANYAPLGAHSFSGMLVKIGTATVAARSGKQSIIAESTCEPELYGQSEACALGLGVAEIVRELGGRQLCLQYCDNRACILQVGGAVSWRSRHYSSRAHGMRCKVERGLFCLRHVPGTLLPADPLTEPLGPTAWRRAVVMLQKSSDVLDQTLTMTARETADDAHDASLLVVQTTADDDRAPRASTFAVMEHTESSTALFEALVKSATIANTACLQQQQQPKQPPLSAPSPVDSVLQEKVKEQVRREVMSTLSTKVMCDCRDTPMAVAVTSAVVAGTSVQALNVCCRRRRRRRPEENVQEKERACESRR